MLLQDLLHTSAQRHPQKTALICDGRRLTYAELDVMANRLANTLIAHGVQRGDRVALYLHNSVEAVVGVFAALRAGGMFVIVNRSTKRDKLIYILNNCRATALIADAQFAARGVADATLMACPSLKFSVFCGERASALANAQTQRLAFDAIQATASAACPPRVNADLDLACLIYTSGSTGEPKGVMCDHGNLNFTCSAMTSVLHSVEVDVIGSVLPLSFVVGLSQLLTAFKAGSTLMLEPSFAYPAAVLRRMADERVTGFAGVPTIYAMLLQMDLSHYDLSSLRYLTSGAAALPLNHISELRRRFPHVRLYSTYGLTETTSRTLYLPPDQLDKRPESVGIAIPGTEVWIEDETGQRLGAGQIGELVVRGPHVARGYWDAPEATAQTFCPGPVAGERVCYTGDLFRLDEEGYLYFVGRKDDIIKTRSEKVAPKEVERVLHSIQGVVEAAVVGVPDPVLGQVVKAFVVVDGIPLTEAAVLAHCRAHLEDHMVPRFVEFRNELPKTASGKIRKINLK